MRNMQIKVRGGAGYKQGKLSITKTNYTKGSPKLIVQKDHQTHLC
jgi:hypothetical protein